MKRIALTGGIASGKSTVASYLEQLGAKVIDADQIAHAIYQQDPLLKNEVLQHFGNRILDKSKNIDRKKLGQIVFANPQELSWLESKLHPAIRKAIQLQIEKYSPPLIIIEAALMIETGYYKDFDGLLLITSSPQLQQQRSIQRDKLNAQDVQNRIKSQWSDAEKSKVANWIIENKGTREELKEKVKLWFEKM